MRASPSQIFWGPPKVCPSGKVSAGAHDNSIGVPGLPAYRKGPSVGISISKKIRFYKTVQNFLKKVHVNLFINKVYYVYIDLHKHIYIPNQAIRAAKC